MLLRGNKDAKSNQKIKIAMVAILFYLAVF